MPAVSAFLLVSGLWCVVGWVCCRGEVGVSGWARGPGEAWAGLVWVVWLLGVVEEVSVRWRRVGVWGSARVGWSGRGVGSAWWGGRVRGVAGGG